MKVIHGLKDSIKSGLYIHQIPVPYRSRTDTGALIKLGIGIAVVVLALGLLVGCAVAEEIYTPEQYCAAIFISEGGAKTTHPYGILAKYKHTTPRQACLNTVRHRMRDYMAEGRGGSFTAYLGKFYAPVGAKNDPQGLNKNWVKNVDYYLKKN